MPQRSSANTDALRTDFAAQLSKAIRGLSKQAAADKLGITRQMLNRYLRGQSTPGAEVVKRACDEWKLTLSIRGFQFKAGAFESHPKRQSDSSKVAQLSLLDLLAKLGKDQVEAKIDGRKGDSFYLTLRIKVVA
jgi:transcriptional regulator with XRE-family HTH domain